MLLAALISVATLLPTLIADPRSRTWPVWGFVALTTALVLICVVQSETEQAQPAMSGAAALRLGLLAVAVNRWLKLAAHDPVPLAPKP